MSLTRHGRAPSVQQDRSLRGRGMETITETKETQEGRRTMIEADTEQEVTMGKLVQDFKVVIHDAESLLKASAGELGEKAKEARARLAASLDSAKANFHKVEERAVAGAKATDKII